MANYCSNSIHLSGKKKLIAKLWHIVKNCTLSKNKSVQNLLRIHGYTSAKAETLADGRDWIMDVDTKIHKGANGEYHFNVYTETAWSPHMEPWFDLIKKKYDNAIRLLYISEECGMEIYQTNDKNAEVWKDKYLIDYRLDFDSSCEYFESKEELIKYVEEVFDVSVSKDATNEEIGQAVLNRFNVKEKSDYYCNVFEFEFDDDYYANAA